MTPSKKKMNNRAEIIITDDEVTVYVYTEGSCRGFQWDNNKPPIVRLSYALNMLEYNYPHYDYVISDQRTLKILPDPEDSRVAA